MGYSGAGGKIAAGATTLGALNIAGILNMVNNSAFDYATLNSRLAGGGSTSQGSGVPTLPNGVNPVAGDIWYRTDTPGTANQRIYICTVGGATPTWVGIL